MKIHFTKDFKKTYKKRVQSNNNLAKRFELRYDLFENDPTNPVLKDHALFGKLQGHRAFSTTGDIRVVYYIFKDTCYFIDIGTHNQVYGK
ncbi:hypothetical protein A2617_03520 [Candidatus Daviesbacteria bacterium RIFOXYD1_FULL_41_10]|uniref:Type II toxin-antitoxin system mRNA interferase toxin, RelE/StbE family n=2 Tax=Candidatus Daviesiibacteriota TaxID=1752718 RepID=A0A1F5N151_9BACT|nr:MAG: Addiction module toxin, RelE/StbE family [Candidatus Daviesbacteria bacterium GW2011_GWB1_41_5]OGE71220.1 MAG: hypothetical protein A2617_03520 [Candidatus Daviesbacteria bacterium RIFOXYD1_FULL_41_10]